jgi:hypothetical protein
MTTFSYYTKLAREIEGRSSNQINPLTMTLPTNAFRASSPDEIKGSPSSIMAQEKDTSVKVSTAPLSGKQQSSDKGDAYSHPSSLPPPPSPYFHVFGHSSMDYSTLDYGRAAASPFGSPGPKPGAHLHRASGSPPPYGPKETSAASAAILDTTELMATPGCTCKKSR